MSETLQPVRPEDLQAAEDLAKEATSTSDVDTLREMLFDQNGGDTSITNKDGTTVEIRQIGKQEFSELGQKATQEALRNLPQSSESWMTEEK